MLRRILLLIALPLTAAAEAPCGPTPPALVVPLELPGLACALSAPPLPPGEASGDPRRDVLYGLPMPDLARVLPAGPTD
jgi:hypothetical protein